MRQIRSRRRYVDAESCVGCENEEKKKAVSPPGGVSPHEGARESLHGDVRVYQTQKEKSE